MQANAGALLKILAWNYVNDIYVFRINTWFITRPHLINYPTLLNHRASTLSEVQEMVQTANMRVSLHAVTGALGTNSPVVREKITAHLEYCNSLLDYMGDKDSCIILHLGKEGKSRYNTRERVIDFLRALSSRLRKRVLLENDQTWHIDDIMYVSKHSACGFVYDIHHHQCWHGVEGFNTETVRYALEAVQKLTQGLTPKVHISSQAPSAPLGRHAELIDFTDYARLRQAMYDVGMPECDIMVEATGHERALLTLRSMIRLKKPRWMRNDAGLV